MCVRVQMKGFDEAYHDVQGDCEGDPDDGGENQDTAHYILP